MPENKPDWSKAPEWAKWWAIDSDGVAYWYEMKPYPKSTGDWTGVPGRAQIDPFRISFKWTETLHGRSD